MSLPRFLPALPQLALIITLLFVSAISTRADAETLEHMAEDAKIDNPEALLEAFSGGKSSARFIIRLTPPPTDKTSGGFRTEAAKRDLKTTVRSTRDKVLSRVAIPDDRITATFNFISGFAADLTQSELAALIADPDVIGVEEDIVVHPNTAQGIPLMNADTLRSEYDGTGVAVAICDTGIDYNHALLGNGVFPNSVVIGGRDTGQDDDDPVDGNGHGTACAGIAAGPLGSTGDYIGGVAPKAKLYALKISSTATGGSAFTSDIVEAWDWCTAHQNDDPNNPIMIISTSFGGGKYSGNCDSSYSTTATAAANAVNAGITLFVSSGNDGYCNSVGAPSCVSDVIAVGAVYDAAFGNYNPCISEDSCVDKTATGGCTTGWYTTDGTAADMVTSYSNSNDVVKLYAPSNKAYTLYPTTTTPSDYTTSFGGTSAACPYAAGAATALQSAAKTLTGSYLTPAEVQTYLTTYGDQLTDPKSSLTRPRVDLQASLEALLGGVNVVPALMIPGLMLLGGILSLLGRKR